LIHNYPLGEPQASALRFVGNVSVSTAGAIFALGVVGCGVASTRGGWIGAGDDPTATGASVASVAFSSVVVGA